MSGKPDGVEQVKDDPLFDAVLKAIQAGLTKDEIVALREEGAAT